VNGVVTPHAAIGALGVLAQIGDAWVRAAQACVRLGPADIISNRVTTVSLWGALTRFRRVGGF
jgi:hypothetical protein